MPGDFDRYGYIETFCQHRDSYFAKRNDILLALRQSRTAMDAYRVVALVIFVGRFKAYEIATSLTYSAHLPGYDEDQVCHLGPGARKAFALLTSGDATSKENLVNMRDAVKSTLMGMPGFRWIPLSRQGSPSIRKKYKFTLRTLEDSLCEFRKYEALSGHSMTAKARTYKKGLPLV